MAPAGGGEDDRPRRPPWQAVLLAVALLSGCGGGRPWNVVLLTLDTTRADFLGCYGKASARTPTLDRLAREGFLFETAYASNPVTQASHSTILTGTYPMAHGVRDNGLFRLPEESVTLAELLSARGYATGAAIGGFPLTREFGTAQGFDLYDDDLTSNRLDLRGRPAQRRFATWYDERPAGHVNDAILPWLRERRGEPFFAWLHYWDPHEPHIAPAPYGELFAHDPYQGEIAYADESLGAVLKALEDLGELDRTLVVVTADHGEGRLEHEELTHAFLAYDTTLRVPLIVRPPAGAPGAPGSRIAERVATVDIVPTILDLLGFEPPESLQGRSLVPLMAGRGDRGERRPYYAESLSPRLTHGFGELRVLYRGPYKYIHGPRPELYDLDRDPDELDDLAAELPRERAGLEKTLRGFLDAHASSGAGDATHEISDEARRRLEALGYLSTTGEAPDAVREELRADGIAPRDRVQDINRAGRLRKELSRGAFHLARETARELLEQSPGHAYYQGKLVTAHLGLREVDAAAAVVDASEAISPANLDEFLEVARALFERGDRERGVGLARRLVAAEETASGHVILGGMLAELGDSAAFERAMERALELDEGNVTARLALAEHFVEQGAFDRAEGELRALFRAYPAYPPTHLAFGRLELARGRPREALAHVERGLTLAPWGCEIHLERLELLVELGRPEEAGEQLAALRRHCRDRETRGRAADLMETLE